MIRQNLDDEAVAAAIKCSRVSVSRWRRRLVRPDWDQIAKLREWSGGLVTADDFEDIGKEAAE